MLRKLLIIVLVFIGLTTYGQQCPVISYPAGGEMDVPVDASITWSTVNGINGYLISLGTSPGGTELLSRASTGIINSYKAPLGLPENTRIYATLSIIDSTAQPVSCGGIVFNTMDVTTQPPCTILIAPDDNATNVTAVTDIIWAYSPTATSYVVSIGTSEGGTDILNELDVGNVLSYDPPIDLPQDLRIYVTVRPENENGSTGPCTAESFFTGEVDDPCEETDEITGQVTSYRPEIELATKFTKCIPSGPITVSPQGEADGFRWYRLEGNTETLLSQNRTFRIDEVGHYLLEAYNIITKSGVSLECVSSRNFNIQPSQIATIESVGIRKLRAGKEVTINAIGFGEYEYVLDDIDGTYQDDPVFVNVPEGPHTVYVRDKNGCGVVSRLIERGLKSEDFPNFFTPNGDGINDFWQFVPPPKITDVSEVLKGNISIFDRYGNLLSELDPLSRGWSGNFNGKPLPSSDYWFKVTSTSQQKVVGHFSLIR